MYKPTYLIAGLIVVAMIVAATLQAGEETVEPVLRKVATNDTVSVTYLAGKGFRIQGADVKGAVDVLNGKIGLLPMLAEGKLNAVGVVTYEPAKEGTKAATWPNLQVVKDVKSQRIDTALNVSFTPVFSKTMLTGFAVVSIAARKGADSEAEVMPAGKADKSVSHKKVSLNLPKTPNAELWYGVMLVPAFDKDGKALKGFDVTLVATPRKAK